MLRSGTSVRHTYRMENRTFSQSVYPLRDRMFRYAQSLLRSSAEAEDAVADCIERLWTERERIATCGKVEAFVMTAVRNRCYDYLRSRRAEERRAEAIAGTAERSARPDTERWEAREVVRRAMAALPDRLREVLHLKEIEGYTTREIAQMTGCDEAYVRTILSRGRKALREVLIKMMNDEKNDR